MVLFFLKKNWFMFTLEDGAKLVKLARKTIEYFLATGKILADPSPDEKFNIRCGVFVTLHKFPTKELRGCIGFIEGIMPLWQAVKHSAINAAFRDPRFEPLSAKELEEVVVEVSILSKPEKLKGEKESFPEQIKIGKDGLLLKKGRFSGVLLPQVAVEWHWDPLTFLQQVSIKAGLFKDSWKDPDAEIYKFQNQIFVEVEPKGEVEEIAIE